MRQIVTLGSMLLLASAAAADGDGRSGEIQVGQAVYSETCIACHGADGKGTISGVPDLTLPNGPLSKSDNELSTSILEGLQGTGSPLGMPPKGGDPSLTNEEVNAVVAYLRAVFGG